MGCIVIDMDKLAPDLLAGLPTVLAAAAEGSATRAAARLGTTPATVLRRIEAVETALGTRLFERLPTGLEPTLALAAVLPWAEQCAAAAHGMMREVTGLDTAPSGVVRVATPPVFASQFLVPALADLRRAHPGVVVEFLAANAVVDLAQREADLAVRVVRPEAGDLVFHKLMDYKAVVAVAPALLDAGPVNTLPFVGWDSTMARIPEARWFAENVPESRVVMRTQDLGTLLAAARVGLGAVVVPEPMAAMAGGLVAVAYGRTPLPGGSLYLVAHRALRAVPRVAAVWRWLTEGFSTTSGRAPPSLASAGG
jgi:DNA-binding transcriptional LysR family regulator